MGLALAVWMAYEYFYPPAGGAVCDFSDVLSCTKLITGGWATLLRVPIAILGINWSAPSACSGPGHVWPGLPLTPIPPPFFVKDSPEGPLNANRRQPLNANRRQPPTIVQ